MALKLDRKESLTSTLLTLNHGRYKDQSTYVFFFKSCCGSNRRL